MLASRGFTVYSFDYQGYGARPHPLKDVTADYFTWTRDAARAVDAVRADLDEQGQTSVPLTWIGHSLGCQFLPFTDHNKLDKGIITCGGTGWWKNADKPDYYIAPLLWWAVAPALVKARATTGQEERCLVTSPGRSCCSGRSSAGQYLFGVHRTHHIFMTYIGHRITFTDDRSCPLGPAHTWRATTVADLTLSATHRRSWGESIGHGLFRRGREDLWERLPAAVATVEVARTAATTHRRQPARTAGRRQRASHA